MAELAVAGLGRRFANFWAVDDVTFSVARGERVAIIGPNGAGKTTLLNLIGGQLEPTTGRIECLGRDVTRMPVHSRAAVGIGRSFQVPSVFPEETVARNVWLGLRRGDSTELLARWGLEDQRDAFPGELSHGDRRRLELAMATAANPRLLLLDEPTAGLTVEEGPRLVQHVHDLGRDVTVLLVDHDMATVFAMAERIIVMHRGKILADGSPAEVRANRRVAEAYGVGGKL